MVVAVFQLFIPRSPRRPIAMFKAVSLLALVGAMALALTTPGSKREQAAVGAEIEPITVTAAGSGRRAVSLRDRLIVGLRARLKSEVAFVDAVVFEVQAGHLPQRIVDETFFWARRKTASPLGGRPRRPILYFQPAMSARAKRLGVDL